MDQLFSMQVINMFRVLLIDDEPVIREGLKTIIDWSAYGFEICGEAVNGRDGLEKIGLLHPDLLILDIKMSGIDGLELLEELQRKGVSIQTIILSGYSEFNYAQKAISLGVTAYVLKPIEEDDLIKQLKKAYQQILAQYRATGLKEAVSLAADKILEELCWEEPGPDVLARARTIPTFESPWKMYRICLLPLHDTMDTWYKELKRKLSNHPWGVGYACRNDVVVTMVLKDAAAAAPHPFLTDLGHELQNRTGNHPFIAAGPAVTELSQLWLSYRKAQKLLEQKFLKESGIVISPDEESETQACDLRPKFEYKLLENLRMALDLNNRTQIEQLMRQFRNKLLSGDYSPEKLKAGYLQLYTAVRISLPPDRSLIQTAETGQAIVDEIYACNSLEDLHQCVLNRLIHDSDCLAKDRPSGVIPKILDYIQRNYYLDLKLESLARLFNYNRAYLGKLFKIHTGVYFHTYLDQVRLEKAKQLLTQGMKVGDVAREVGYRDIDYFHAKFKKYFAIGPSFYKTSRNNPEKK